MRSGPSVAGQAPERRSTGSAACGALALVSLLAGCGTSSSARRHVENVEIKRFLARVKCPRTTLTRKELGETYSEDAWVIASQPFTPVYEKITEADAFQWEYLREVQARRRGLFAREDKIKAAQRKRAAATAERERRRKAKDQARAAAEAERLEAIENADLAPAVTAPGAAPTAPE